MMCCLSSRRWIEVFICTVLFFSNVTARIAFAIDEIDVAGIVYNETSGLRAIKGSEKELEKGREAIAKIAYKRDGKGMAAPVKPTAEEMKFLPAKSAWEASVAAAKAVKGQDAGDCIHVFIWPSSDKGKTPNKSLKVAKTDKWPFEQTAKLKVAYGPISCPKKVGDVPQSSTVYIFVYCGVK